MFDFMDSRFYMRRILISNICWIILSFLHDGAHCQPMLEVSGSGLINTPITFNCTYTGKLQYYAVFRKSGTLIATFSLLNAGSVIVEPAFANKVTATLSKQNYTNSYIMNVNNLQCSDEGKYECMVNYEQKDRNTFVDLQVKAKPQMPTLKAPSSPVVLGDTVTLECTANVGKPARNLSLCIWQEQGFNCSQVSTLVDLGNCSSTQTATMTVNITEDTNQAKCEVIAPDEKPLIVIPSWEVLFPVLDIKFGGENSQVSLLEGESRTITCEARGRPAPSYRWDYQLTEGAPYKEVGLEKKLILKNVGLSNKGIYSCIASNDIRNVTYNMTKSITVNVAPTTTAPTTTTIATTETSSGSGGKVKPRPQTNDKKDGWKLIVAIVGAILFLIILVILVVVLYRRRSKPAEIEEPPEKPRNNHHEVNMMETKPDLVYSTGLEKGKLPMYNTGFDHNGEDDLYYAELAFDDKPRSRKPIVPLYDNSSNNDPYTAVMPHV